MPAKKMKKPPCNAYYYYMVKRKRELEMEGYRFPGGMKDVAQALGSEWSQLSTEDKEPFEKQARVSKVEGKTNLDNKFTVTGESYAQVQRRVTEDKAAADEQDDYISELAIGEGTLDRIFILIKTTHCVEQIVQKNKRIYWPLELGMAAFSFREGLRSTYWTLIDTKKTPVGYASAAKEISEETCLPEPGSKLFSEDHRDYNKIMKNFKGFVEFWLKKGYRRGPVVFAMDQETNYARGCFEWLVEHMDEEKQQEYWEFLDRLKMFTLPKVILKLAEYANQLDPDYKNVMTMYNLEHSAGNVLSKGCFDYRDEITCLFHKTETASLKMPTCCRNIVLKRMFLMFEEFLPAFGLQKLERHDIDKLGTVATKPKPKPISTRAVSKDEEQPQPGTSASSSSSSDMWGRASKPDNSKEPKHPFGTRRDDVSEKSLERNKRKHEDELDSSSSKASHHEGPPAKVLVQEQSCSSAYFRDRPPSPSLTAEDQDQSTGFVPWGRTREAPAASFGSEDFPELGSAPLPKSGRVESRGRGRGVSIPRNEEDDGSNDPGGRSTYY